ncbi:carboxypeptidase-like regulatory domain-containing protein [Candidatus Latescibacterota bacterium]
MKSLPIIMFMSVILFCSSQTSSAQEKFTLSGTVTDGEMGERLIGVSVYEDGTPNGTMTSADGIYSLILSRGTHTITYAFIGYEKIEEKITLSQNRRLNIKLSPKVFDSDEVVVRSKRREDENVTSTEVSVEKLDIEQVEKIPVIMGETDIMKTIQLLPGITSVAEGRSGFIVRGSGIDQNLILMDGMPLYYSSHMQGLYSVFNSDAVDELTVYKGGIPARFGGRGASVLDVRMKEGGFDRYRAKLSLGLITSKFSVEAPVIKNKLSVFLAGRSTKTSLGHLYDESKDDDLHRKFRRDKAQAQRR